MGLVFVSIFTTGLYYDWTLLNEFKHAGKYSINWDATNHASGIYIAKMTTQEYMHDQKLMLIK